MADQQYYRIYEHENVDGVQQFDIEDRDGKTVFYSGRIETVTLPPPENNVRKALVTFVSWDRD